MRLPRYTAAQSQPRITQELQSVRAGTIRPGERAQETTAKFGAVAAVADAFSQVAKAEAESRAEEEYTDAVFDYESRLQEYDVEVETRGFELDGNDNIIVDDKEMVKQEMANRTSVSSDIRDNITSGAGKRKFDTFMMQSNLSRNAEYTQRATERRVKALGAQAEHKVNTLITNGNFDAAYERGRIALENGVISQPKWDQMRELITQKRTTSTVDNALMGETNAQELNTILVALDAGKWEDGKPIGIDTNMAYMYSNRIGQRLAGLDSEADAEVDKQREGVYLDLLVPVINGEVGVDELRTRRYELDDKRFDKLIGYAITASRRPTESDSNVLEAYERRVIELRIGKGYDPAYVGYKDTVNDVIEAMSMDTGMATEDINRLITDLDSYTNAIRNNPDLEDILNVELSKITGRKVDQFMVRFEGQDKSNITEAQRLERDFKRAMLQAGPRNIVFNGEEWMRKNVSAYHLKVQTDTLKRYKIPAVPMLNGQLDTNKLGVMMLEYQMGQTKANETGQGLTEQQARLQAEIDYQAYLRMIEAG